MPHDVASLADIVRWRGEARAVHIEPRLARYIVGLVSATRAAHDYIDRGASPRATLALAALARARAYVDGRDFAVPDDVRAATPAVLRHRLAFNYRTITDRVDPEVLIGGVVASVTAP
jgi:MoxR-like ATPase